MDSATRYTLRRNTASIMIFFYAGLLIQLLQAFKVKLKLDILLQTARALRALNMQLLVRKYISRITPEKKAIMEEKVLASALFREKKKGYEESVAKPFVGKREGILFLFHITRLVR